MSWFTQLERSQITAWLDYNEGLKQLPPVLSKFDVPESFRLLYSRDANAEEASRDDKQKAERPPAVEEVEDMRSFSWMVTNNMVMKEGPPEDVAEIIDAKLQGRALEKALLKAESVIALWDEYLAWVKQNCSELGDVKISCKLEVSHDATDPRKCLLHGHVAITNMMTRFRLVNRRRMWDFCNSPAFIVTNKGRGRSAYKSIYRNNYYCQVKKIGTLFSWTNWQAIKHHPVELSFIFGLWKAYKLSSAAAIVQMRYARGRGMQGYLNEINEDRRWKSQVRERAEKIAWSERSHSKRLGASTRSCSGWQT